MVAADDVAFLHRLADAADAVSRRALPVGGAANDHEGRRHAGVGSRPCGRGGDARSRSRQRRLTRCSARRSVRSRARPIAGGSSTASTARTTTPMAARAGARSSRSRSTARSSWEWSRLRCGVGVGGRYAVAARGSASYAEDGSFDAAAAEPLRCGSQASLADATTIVIPWEGAVARLAQHGAEALPPARVDCAANASPSTP